MKRMDPKAGRVLVAAFERTDKGVLEFCEDQGVSYPVLKYWRNRIAELDDDQSEPSAFVQIDSQQHSLPTEGGEVSAAAMAILPNGVRIAFQKSNDVTVGVIEALSDGSSPFVSV